MGKINVYLPDELEAALAPYREKLNVSRVCADALREEIERMAMIERGLTDRDALVARLRQEKRQVNRGAELAGRREGAADAARLHYEDLRRIGELQLDLSYVDQNVYFSFLPEEVQENVQERVRDGEERDTPGFGGEEWAYGWLSAVQDFWAEVEREL